MPKKRCPLRIDSTRQKIERNAPAVRALSLPRDSPKIGHNVEVLITRKNWQMMLARLRRNPKIVPRNWAASRRELLSQHRVIHSCDTTNGQRREFLFNQS